MHILPRINAMLDFIYLRAVEQCWRNLQNEINNVDSYLNPQTSDYEADTLSTRPRRISLELLLKLYCGYKYTRPCMINRIWGLKEP